MLKPIPLLNVARSHPALVKILRAEGLGGIYKGIRAIFHKAKVIGYAPKVLRLAPGGGILLLGKTPAGIKLMILVVEALSSVFRTYLGAPYI